MNLPKRSSFKSVLKVYTLSKILLWMKPSYFSLENACDSWYMHQIGLFSSAPVVCRKVNLRASCEARRPLCHKVNLLSCVASILGDPGAVSRARLKGVTKVFKHRRKSPWVPTLTGPFPNGQENACSWLGTKNALYCCAQSANSISWVLFVSSYTTAIISPQLPGSFTKLS